MPTRIHHPNREKAESKTMKAIVVFLLLVSAALISAVIIGGWSVLQGAQPMAVLYIVLTVVFAIYIARWNRGLLPVAAGASLLFAVVAAIAAPAWFARDKPGFADSLLDPALLGLLTILIVPVQLLVVVFAMRALSQDWHVEVEVEDESRHDPPARSGSSTAEPLGA
jgi:lysylphosphatidylglycerol synthetase-like protein (DUF2156 family)